MTCYTTQELADALKARGLTVKAVSTVRLIVDNGMKGPDWKGLSCDVLGKLIDAKRVPGLEQGAINDRVDLIMNHFK
jgi:hypothetical protein